MTNDYEKYVFLYINGKLDPRDVHFLEHNDEFMKTAVKFTRDPDMFYRCSDNLKNDGKFIKELVEVILQEEVPGVVEVRLAN